MSGRELSGNIAKTDDFVKQKKYLSAVILRWRGISLLLFVKGVV
jgi:hypothetical protein